MGGGGKEGDFRSQQNQTPEQPSTSPRQEGVGAEGAERTRVHAHLSAKGDIYTAEQSAAKAAAKPLKYRSGAEKRQRVKAELLEHPELKYWEIAERIGLTSAAVQKHAFRLQQSGEVAYRRPNSTKEVQARSKKRNT